MKILNTLNILIFSTFFLLSNCQSTGKVWNVGYGVFLIGFSIVLAGIICLLGRATRYPEFVFIFALIIPIFLILFFALTPKEADREQIDKEQFEIDYYLIPRVIYLVIFILTFCCICCRAFQTKLKKPLFAVRVANIAQKDHDNFFDNEPEKPAEKINENLNLEEKKEKIQENSEFLKENEKKEEIQIPIQKDEPKKIFKKKKEIKSDIEEQKKFLY